MTSKHVDERLPLYLLGELDPSEYDEITGHLAACTRCRDYADKLQNAINCVQDSLPKSPSDARWDEISKAAYKKAGKKGDSSSLTSMIASLFKRPALAVAAVVIMAAVTILLFFSAEQAYFNAGTLAERYVFGGHKSTGTPTAPQNQENFVLGFQKDEVPVANAYVVGHAMANAMIVCSLKSTSCQPSIQILRSNLRRFPSTKTHAAMLAATADPEVANRQLKPLDTKVFPTLKKDDQYLYSLGAWSRYLQFAVTNESVQYDLESANARRYIKGLTGSDLPVGVSRSLKRILQLTSRHSGNFAEYRSELNKLNSVFL